ncbi:MAG: hypothetical protein CME93_05845 [Hyphomonadaceae bacterium]|nr:hypothetical protein [Hyphomonadaceae bacterium]
MQCELGLNKCGQTPIKEVPLAAPGPVTVVPPRHRRSVFGERFSGCNLAALSRLASQCWRHRCGRLAASDIAASRRYQTCAQGL